MLISTEKGKIKVGTTNSEAVVSISSIELHVFKSQLLQKVQTKSTISKSLATIDPAFKLGNKNLENQTTGALIKTKTNIHYKSCGMFVKKKHIFFFFSSILRSQHDETDSVYLPRERP